MKIKEAVKIIKEHLVKDNEMAKTVYSGKLAQRKAQKETGLQSRRIVIRTDGVDNFTMAQIRAEIDSPFNWTVNGDGMFVLITFDLTYELDTEQMYF